MGNGRVLAEQVVMDCRAELLRVRRSVDQLATMVSAAEVADASDDVPKIEAMTALERGTELHAVTDVHAALCSGLSAIRRAMALQSSAKTRALQLGIDVVAAHAISFSEYAHERAEAIRAEAPRAVARRAVVILTRVASCLEEMSELCGYALMTDEACDSACDVASGLIRQSLEAGGSEVDCRRFVSAASDVMRRVVYDDLGSPALAGVRASLSIFVQCLDGYGKQLTYAMEALGSKGGAA